MVVRVERRVEHRCRSGSHPEPGDAGQLRSLATGREAAGARDGPRLVGGLDPWGDDPVSAAVEQPADGAVLALRDADQRRQAEVTGSGTHRRRHVETHGGVLEVDQDGVVARRVRDADHVGGAGPADAEHEGGSAGASRATELGS